jgi:Leucine-rich repeat (LRR) protein
LISLDCNSLEITALDLSGCGELTNLYCGSLGITELDLSYCPELRQLDITDVPLTALDLSGCPKLESVVIQETEISALDLSGKKELTTFSAYGNPLKSVDLTGCDQLKIRGVRVEGVGTLDVQLSKNERCRIAAHPGYGYHLIEWQNLAGKPLNPELQTDGEIYFYAGTYDSVVARFGK